jgi:hypothetical protein
MRGALTGSPKFIGEFVKRLNIESAAPYTAFMHVIDRDARDARGGRSPGPRPAFDQLAAGGQPERLDPPRALLTDLFLIDEVFKVPPSSARQEGRRPSHRLLRPPCRSAFPPMTVPTF